MMCHAGGTSAASDEASTLFMCHAGGGRQADEASREAGHNDRNVTIRERRPTRDSSCVHHALQNDTGRRCRPTRDSSATHRGFQNDKKEGGFQNDPGERPTPPEIFRPFIMASKMTRGKGDSGMTPEERVPYTSLFC